MMSGFPPVMQYSYLCESFIWQPRRPFAKQYQRSLGWLAPRQCRKGQGQVQALKRGSVTESAWMWRQGLG